MPSLTLGRTTPGALSDANADLNNNWSLLENLVNGALDTSNVTTATAVTQDGNANAAGNATTLARSNHTHLIQGVERRAADPTTGHFVGRVYFNTGTALLMVCTDDSPATYIPFSPVDAPADGEMLRAVGAVPTWVPSVVAFDEFDAPVSVTATTEAASQTIADSGAVAYEAVPHLIEFFAPYVQPAASSGASVIFSLWDGATDLGLLTSVQTPAAAIMIVPCRVAHPLTPTAASHQYIVKAYRGGGNGTVGAGTGGIAGFLPGFVRVTRV